MTKDIKKWLIISWKHVDHLDGAYGKLIDTFKGTYEEACSHARAYVPEHSPVGICGEATHD